MTKTKPHENPLINHKKLQQLYVAMVQARVLDEHLSSRWRRRKSRLDSTYGQEACRVSTAIELVEGDLVSDAQKSVVMDLVAGVPVRSVMRRAVLLASKKSAAKLRGAVSSAVSRQLPWIEDPDDRLKMALGAAMAFKTLKHRNIVVVYIRAEDAAEESWLETLEITSRFVLPIIFVVLPTDRKNADTRTHDVLEAARLRGIPGIPVDASDAVALYRVAQESIGRTRNDGGPVVIECVYTEFEGCNKRGIDDPLPQMRKFILSRKASSERRLDALGASFRRRVKAASIDDYEVAARSD